MTVKEAAYFLSGLSLGDTGKRGSLRHLVHLAGGPVYADVKNAVKDKVVAALSEYYCTPGLFDRIWKSLNDAERKIIAFHIWADGSEPLDCAEEIAREFGIKQMDSRDYYWYYYNALDRFKYKFTKKDSKLWLLFPKDGKRSYFYEEICIAVGQALREYSVTTDDFLLTTREHRATDFANIVRFCNTKKVSLTKNGAMSKASAIKLWKFCGYEEYTADINGKPEDMRTADELLVTYPLIMSCMVGGLLAVEENVCVPGGKAVSLLHLPHEQLIKRLFDAYLKSKGYDEISAIKGIKPKHGHNPALARQNLADVLRGCPVDQAIFTHDLERYLKIYADTFARKDTWRVADTGSNHNYGTDWIKYEHPLLFKILGFFGALGIIDIVWGVNRASYWERDLCIPVAFRINALGAYVLGLSDEYTAHRAEKADTAGGFTVLPDYTIVVPENPRRLQHELYFERLFTRVSSTDEAAIYKIDFETIVRALDSGTGIDSLREYLAASDKPLPENVARALYDWQKQSGRIRLRQVTILECDDEALLEEVIRYKGMGDWVRDRVAAAVVIDADAANKIKKAVEKNKRFCSNVL